MDIPNRAHEFHFVPHDTVIETRFPEPSCVPKATDSVASNPLDVLHHSSDLGVAGWLQEGVKVIGHYDVREYTGTLLVAQPTKGANYSVGRSIDQEGLPASRGRRDEIEGVTDVDAAKRL